MKKKSTSSSPQFPPNRLTYPNLIEEKTNNTSNNNYRSKNLVKSFHQSHLEEEKKEKKKEELPETRITQIKPSQTSSKKELERKRERERKEHVYRIDASRAGYEVIKRR